MANVSKEQYEGNTARVFDLLHPEASCTAHERADDTRNRLLAAEQLADEPYLWADIAIQWLQHFGAAELPSAVRCASKSAMYPNFCGGWISGAEAWFAIAQYEPTYLEYAVLWLRRAEDYIELPGDTSICARTWMRLSLAESADNALRLMKLAEERYLVGEECRDDIVRDWILCFGEEAGGDHARRFIAKTK